jgi:two-component system response regulator FixJ
MHDFGTAASESPDRGAGDLDGLDADDGDAFESEVVVAGEASATQRLSPRERQVMTLVIDGKTRKQIAFDLGIAHSTVRVLYARAMQKLSNRARPVRRRHVR